MHIRYLFVLLITFLNLTIQSQDVTPIFQTGHFSKVNKVLFHPNSENLISVGDDGKIIVWDINLGLQRTSILAHTGGVLDFDFLNDSTLISLGINNQLSTWSFPNLKKENDYQINTDSIQAIAVIENQKICLVGKRVHFYNPLTQNIRSTQYHSKFLFQSVDYNEEQHEILVTGPKDNFAVSVDLRNPVTFKKYYVGNIHKAKYADNLQLLSTTGGSVQYFDLSKTKRRIYTLINDLNYVIDMDASSTHIALGTAFGFTTILDRTSHNVTTNIGLDGNAISAVRYSQKGNWLALANTKGTIFLYDTENYNINRILKGASASITDLKILNKQMVVGYSDGIIRHIKLSDNVIKSNSIKLDVVQEQDGINYAVLSIDTLIRSKIYFTVLKSDRHHSLTSFITEAKKVDAEWDLTTNQILLKKAKSSRDLRRKVDLNFKNRIPFQFKDFQDKSFTYLFKGDEYVISKKGFFFSRNSSVGSINYPIKHTSSISGLRFLPSYNLIISFSNDGSIRFWDTEGHYLAVLYLSGQYNFFYQDAENHYFASKEILNKLGFIYEDRLFAYEQFDVYYNRPAEVMKKLSYFDKEDIFDYQKAYFKRLQKLGILINQLTISNDLPQLIVNYFGDYSTREEKAKFLLSMADSKNKIIAYSYLINGIERRFDLEKPELNMTAEVEIELASGINQIEFYCTNKLGVRSLLKKKIITCEKKFEKPDLFLITIGVSNYQDNDFNLKYAQKDAKEISELLSDTKAYGQVLRKEFYDQSFNEKTYDEISEFLKEANINDVIILFFAGHGVLDEQFNYFLATHSMDFNNPADKGLSFDEVENLFESLECRNKLIMIDACFSGEIDKGSVAVDTSTIENKADIQFRSVQAAAIDGNGDMGIFELSKRVFTDLRVSKGTNILSSSSGIEYSLEGDKWGNGLFTHVLKEGLEGNAADLNDDKQIRILELQVYLRETVSTLSNGNQNPILRKENIKNNFVIW